MTSTEHAAHQQQILRYFELAPGPDVEQYVGQFAADAVVEDDGLVHRGQAEIREWRTAVPTVAYRVAGVGGAANDETATVDISGDFPGSPVRLAFTFRFDTNGRIARLTIRP